MEEATAAHGPAWRRRLVLLLLLLVAGSIYARSSLRKEKEEASAPPLGPNQLVAQDQRVEEPEEPPSGWQRVLPFVTEAGVAMLLGLALGAATRSVAKVLALVFALCFIGIQILAYKGVLEVDWGSWLNDFVLNISQFEGLNTFVQEKLPAAGAFLIGYFLGIRRG